MVYRRLRIPVWLIVAALFMTFVIGTSAGPAVMPDIHSSFRIVTSDVSEVITRDVTPEIARSLGMSRAEGVVISDVMCFPLRPGDVILSINGTPVRCQTELDAQLAQVSSGQTFFVEVYRDGRIETVTVQRAMPPPPTILEGTEQIRGIRVAGLSTQNGVIVTDVQIGTPASDAGLLAGDIILDVDAHPVRTAGEFLKFMRQLSNRQATFSVRHTNGQVDVFVIPS
jgi:S1-C subfamily serine protease